MTKKEKAINKINEIIEYNKDKDDNINKHSIAYYKSYKNVQGLQLIIESQSRIDILLDDINDNYDDNLVNDEWSIISITEVDNKEIGGIILDLYADRL